MVWERFDGARRDVTWGELQDLSNQAANVLRDHGVEPGERVAVVLPPTPETAAVFFGTWKNAGILLSMSVLYGDDGIAHRLRDSQPRVLVTDKANAPRFDPSLVERDARARRRPARRRLDRVRDGRHRRRRSGPALLHERHHRPGQGHRPRPPLRARARGVRLLPRGPGRRALPRHGGVGVGGRHLAAARAVAPGRHPGRPAAQGRLRPRPAAGLPQPPRGHERLHHAHGDAGDDGHRGRRHPLPAEVPPRVLGGRAAQSRGHPLVPRAVRAHRARLLRPHRELPARGQLPLPGGPRGLDGPPDARLGRPAPRRGRAARGPGRARRDLPARALEPPLSARLLAQPGGLAGDLRRRLVSLQGRRDGRRGRLHLVRRAAPTT